MNLTTCPHCGGDLRMDFRERPFRVRLRLYDMRSPNADDPIADSAEGHAPDAPGVDIIRGVRNVLTEAASLAAAYHGGAALHGFDPDTMARKDRGCRSTLSRTGGRARITVDYDTPDSFSDGRLPPRYTARMDLIRLEQPKEGETP